MLETVSFEVDDTLVDPVDLHAKAWVDAVHDYGYDVGFTWAGT